MYCRCFPSQIPYLMSSSSLGAHPGSDSSCCSWSLCRRRLGVIISKITRNKKNQLLGTLAHKHAQS
ncbi:hypothetical protein AHAS_Ahas17G0118400 [Arachis hypogaea]